MSRNDVTFADVCIYVYGMQLSEKISEYTNTKLKIQIFIDGDIAEKNRKLNDFFFVISYEQLLDKVYQFECLS